MAKNKIERIDQEIEKTREKIAEYQEKLKTLEAQKTEAENLEIVQMVRALRMTPAQLNAMLSGGMNHGRDTALSESNNQEATVPFPVSWTVKMKKKQKETQDILSYHSQAAGCSDKARAKASGGRQPIEECGRTGL